MTSPAGGRVITNIDFITYQPRWVRQHSPGPDPGIRDRNEAEVKATQPPDELTPEQLKTRYNIVRSLAGNTQRDPARNLELIRAALDGATVQDLFDMERLGTGAF